MLISSNWKDYEILDTSNAEKLERWGEYILVRPDPQVIWDYGKINDKWNNINAHYHRSRSGGGYWEFIDLPEKWKITYNNLTFNIKPFNFKHTGIFPEQATNWDWAGNLIKKRKNPSILNLFAYTGAATISAAYNGANVVHVDASKKMTLWAKENALSSNLSNAPIRWIVDDCIKFIEREIRRKNKYDAIIMDPPSYGRGPNKEVWKIENKLQELINKSIMLLSDNPLFILVNSYTTSLAPGVLNYILSKELKKYSGNIYCDELGLPISDSSLVLPCGSCARYEFL